MQTRKTVLWCRECRAGDDEIDELLEREYAYDVVEALCDDCLQHRCIGDLDVETQPAGNPLTERISPSMPDLDHWGESAPIDEISFEEFRQRFR